MACAPVDLPEREPLRRRDRGVERDRTRDEGQLQITLPVGAGCRHRKTPTQRGINSRRCRWGLNGRKQLGFQPASRCVRPNVRPTADRHGGAASSMVAGFLSGGQRPRAKIRRPYPPLESLSLRQLRKSRVFSARTCWQLSPVAATFSQLNAGFHIGGVCSFFSNGPFIFGPIGLVLRLS
jgi:hypothetical protein